MKKLMLVDQTNQFFKNFVVQSDLSTNGENIGAIVGSLKSIQKQIGLIKPDSIILVWDGAGGSAKRKQINSAYKDGRKPIKMAYNTQNLTDEEQHANKAWQQIKLMEMINCLPIAQLMLPDVEADDVISFIARHSTYRDYSVVIVSSDKDFFQLADSKTIIYRPTQEEVYNMHTVLSEFSIHPNNFAVARALCGDKSDNLIGVGGIGLPTAAKRFPMLAEDRDVLLTEVFDYCQKQINAKTKLTVYSHALEKRALIQENYNLMQLANPQISVQTAEKINYILNNFKPTLNWFEFQKKMITDGFASYNWSVLQQACNRIVQESK